MKLEAKHWVNMGVSLGAIAGVVALTIWANGQHVEALIGLLIGLQIPGSNAEAVAQKVKHQ